MMANVEDVTVVNVKYRGEPLVQDAEEIVMYGVKYAEDVVCVLAPRKAVENAITEYAEDDDNTVHPAGETLTEYLERRFPTTPPPATMNLEVDEDGRIVEDEDDAEEEEYAD
jgi:hypothetical protein